MTTQIEEIERKFPEIEPEKLEPGSRAGRPRHDRFMSDIEVEPNAPVSKHFEVGSIEAARYLRAVVNGSVKMPDWARIKASEYVIDHAIGKAVPKLQVPQGGNLLYFQLIMIAQQDAKSINTEKTEVLPKDSENTIESENTFEIETQKDINIVRRNNQTVKLPLSPSVLKKDERAEESTSEKDETADKPINSEVLLLPSGVPKP